MAVGGGAEDPGWRSALGGLWWMMLPGGVIRQQRHAAAAGTHGLTVLRRCFASFACAVVMIGVVVVLLSATTTVNPHPVSVIAVAVGIIVFGIFSVVAPWLVERPLDCSDDRILAASYRTRFFLRIAFAEAAALAGFVGFILSNNGWMYAVGAGFATVGYYRAAPTAANLAEDQRVLSHAPCVRSLIAALASLPPPSSTSRRTGIDR